MSKHASKRNVAAKQKAATAEHVSACGKDQDETIVAAATAAEISRELLWASLARLEAQAECLQNEISTIRNLIVLGERC